MTAQVQSLAVATRAFALRAKRVSSIGLATSQRNFTLNVLWAFGFDAGAAERRKAERTKAFAAAFGSGKSRRWRDGDILFAMSTVSIIARDHGATRGKASA
ncbi:MAG: hypothetical protein A2040_12740 [Rhodocyclales bacterium GWA2_65_19]|nr:MAG: hypothetical protein A2040_12740 [Rhodocyclales bacterium GWA2_65_19]